MTKELSGLTVVIIVAGGILTLILLFIFVKRQIVRFALRSRRGPHVPVGHDAKKSFRREIDRRIECIPKILYEPKILDTNDPKYILPPSENCIYLSSLYYRSRAVDDVKKLAIEITKNDKTLLRHPFENLRAYLLNTLATPLTNISQHTIHQFCDLYEHARYDPNEFIEEYRIYSRILLKLLDAARMLKGYNNVNKLSPNNRTQLKKMAYEKLGHATLKDINSHANDEIRRRLSVSNLEKNGETPV